MIFWQGSDSKGINAKCEYSDGIYTVTVSKQDKSYSKSFGQTFTPTFGMDVADAAMSEQVAEELALKIEADLGL